MGEAAYDRARLHRRGVRLEWFTVSWNLIEAVIAIGALLMLPVIVWQGWETFGEAREEGEGMTFDAD